MMIKSEKKVPSLVHLCITTAIDNIRYLGDVGETDIHLLKEILPHCTVDQLMHIEKSTEGRDLSPITNSLWKKFYAQHFGEESMDLVITRMTQKQVVFKWRLLYEAKLKERDEAQQKSIVRMRKLYDEEGAKKQSRMIQICSKVPPSSNKRSYFGGSGNGNGTSNVKGNLMKKARMEFLNSHEVKVHQAMRQKALQTKAFSSSSHEVKVHQAMRQKALQTKAFSSSSVSRPIRPSGGLQRKGSSSGSSVSKPSSFNRRHLRNKSQKF